MPSPTGRMWQHFSAYGKPVNTAHKRAYCHGCISNARPSFVALEVDEEGHEKVEAALKQDWFKQACDDGTLEWVRGEKTVMANHILGSGNRPGCPHASKSARKDAKWIKEESGGSDDEESEAGSSSKRKKVKRMERLNKVLTQSTLKAYKGNDMPFPKESIGPLERQAERATLSANLPWRWIEDIEVQILFYMMRTEAPAVLPTAFVLSGRLLDEMGKEVEGKIEHALKGRSVTLSSDGWKDGGKNGGESVTGVNVAVAGKRYLVSLLVSTAEGKDGATMCKAFGDMIDKTERTYGCIVRLFVTDNDGGAQAGRKDLGGERPWLLVQACSAHQGQLVTHDYFKEDAAAALTAEQVTELIGWIRNHQRVKAIFDDTQLEVDPDAPILAYLVANLTRWTTHYLAARRLLRLRQPLQRAAFNHQRLIIKAQVGAEKNKKKVAKMTDEASSMCLRLHDPAFWGRLTALCNDLEPIAYATNMNQSDSIRPDEVMLSFAGIFLYFRKHTVPTTADGMKRWLEARWRTYDQHLLVMTLILNPNERLSRFGKNAAINPFTIASEFMRFYTRVMSRPTTPSANEPSGAAEPETRADSERGEREARVRKAFLHYLADTGPFADWAEHRATFTEDPIMIWQQFLSMAAVRDLASFAIMCLELCLNQAGNERDFSDLKIKQTRLRNRLKIPRLEKMSKVGASIRAEHTEQGVHEARRKRQIHEDSRVAELLAVPRYADVIEGVHADPALHADAESSRRQPTLITSKTAWREVMAVWAREQQESEALAAEAGGEWTPTASGSGSRWLPRSLELLFGVSKKPAEAPRHKGVFRLEERLMELLEAEASDEETDEDSGDEYDPGAKA
ncbi:hypothetical protein K523DRAFT_255488 [Schizophyllum commune Tattone D]|nr:hypothetical protein K523DRAFT_255488 [Schizophyllum commune Tattone D]